MEKQNNSEALTALRSRAVPKGPFNVTPYFARRARGAVIHDVEGRELVDFAGGIGVMNVGHCHPKVVAAIKEQAEAFTHTCFHVLMYELYPELADRLCRLTPGSFPKMAMFANSGAEAVENAVKVARHYTKRAGVIAFEHAFHGRTLLTMSLTGKVKPYKFGFGPFAPEVYRMPIAYCYRCPFGLQYPQCHIACADYLEEFFTGHVAAENVAALIVEPVLGEGGFITPPPEYFPKLHKICKANDIAFIADEIQSGMGRTGKMFAIEHWRVQPDLITVAKSLAAGMPLSALIGRKEMLDDPMVGGLGGTYGGNPVCCRAALAVLDIFEQEKLLARGEKLGRKIRRQLEDWQKEFELIGDVRGLGPMMAMELVDDRESKKPATDKAKALIKFAYQNGLVLLACGHHGNVVRLLMPLTISDTELERGLAILGEGLSSIS
jgi:4-aminobutyrate aminotransferase/(S)-3-amino-2-methylpropionate transaminase